MGAPLDDRSAAKIASDPISIKQRTCGDCGMLLEDAGEYHPYAFCVLKKAGLNPWPYVREMTISLTGTDPGEKPPLLRRKP